MQYLSPVTATDRYSLPTKLPGNISDKLSLIFSVFLPSKPSGGDVFHGEIMCTVAQTPSKYAVFVPLIVSYHCPVPNCTKFRENIEIPQKWANSVARLKIPH